MTEPSCGRSGVPCAKAEATNLARLMRRWVLAAGATALIVLPTVLAFFSGGFFDKPRIIAALVAWVLVVLAALFSPRPLPVSTAGRLALLGLALLCAWTALSITWAPIGGRAQDDLQRLLLYLGVFTAAVGAAPRARRAPGARARARARRLRRRSRTGCPSACCRG